MLPIRIRDLEIGEGIPKICVPIVGKSPSEVLEQARNIVKLPADLVEWRCDWYEQADSCESVQTMLHNLREVLGEKPLLFTFRTAAEGGACSISKDYYVELNSWALDSGCVDLIDVELFMGDEVMQKMLAHAKAHHVAIVASNHDFEKTPPQEEMLSRLIRMQELGADILKIAVMPQCEADVEVLLDTTKKMAEQYAERPLVTMSMSELGLISRIEGELYGSAITFGAAGAISAPGQVPVGELKESLIQVHVANETEKN